MGMIIQVNVGSPYLSQGAINVDASWKSGPFFVGKPTDLRVQPPRIDQETPWKTLWRWTYPLILGPIVGYHHQLPIIIAKRYSYLIATPTPSSTVCFSICWFPVVYQSWRTTTLNLICMVGPAVNKPIHPFQHIKIPPSIHHQSPPGARNHHGPHHSSPWPGPASTAPARPSWRPVASCWSLVPGERRGLWRFEGAPESIIGWSIRLRLIRVIHLG